jgi:hypothetical protein
MERDGGEKKLHAIVSQEFNRDTTSYFFITHITGVLCKIFDQNRWVTGRVMFSRADGKYAYVYTEPAMTSPWVDFSAKSDSAVLFTTEQVFYHNKLARKYRGTIKGLTLMRCFNDGMVSSIRLLTAPHSPLSSRALY